MVRLALYTAENGGWREGGERDELYNLVRDGVSFATEADLYAIVDWHVLSDANPLAHADEAVGFFGRISADLSGNNNVIYEICNEPNNGTTWEDVKAYAQRIIPIIRANDSDAVIIVGTPTWCQDVDQAAAAPLDAGNVMYALHFYAATHQADLRDRMAAAVRAGLPVFVSEFGICDASGNGTIGRTSADAWVAAMNELGISYACWNLSNKDEASRCSKARAAKRRASPPTTCPKKAPGCGTCFIAKAKAPQAQQARQLARQTRRRGRPLPQTIRVLPRPAARCTAAPARSTGPQQWPTGGKPATRSSSAT